jgi:hypothetical protein
MHPIAFLAIAEAQQLYHWLPAALALSRDADMHIEILSPSPAILAIVADHDALGRIGRVLLRRPTRKPDSLFEMPSRLATLALNYPTIRRYPTIVTTETSSALLRRLPGFRSKLVEIKHGAGDRAGGYKHAHAAFDLVIVAGEKDRERLIARGLQTPDSVTACGYAKFEVMAPRQKLFDNDLPVILYNPHFDPALSSWVRHGPQMLAALESLQGYNVVIAPHTKLARCIPPIRTDAPHILVDMGSVRSIDMSYTNSADIYLGDVSSQVYEFILHPRPCLFLNLDRYDWQDDQAFAHFTLGQVVDRLADLPSALDRAGAMQSRFESVQKAAMRFAINDGPVPASRRQADAIRAVAVRADRAGRPDAA